MPLVFVPLPEIWMDNQENIPAQRQAALKYQEYILNQLGAQQQVNQPLEKGMPKGLRVFTWPEKYDAFLITHLIFHGTKGSFLFRSSSLVRKKDCNDIGSTWDVQSASNFPVQLENSQSRIQEISKRSFQSLSPLKMTSQFLKPLSKKWEILLNIYTSEMLAAQGFPTITTVGRFFCYGNKSEDPKSVEISAYPSQPHLVVDIKAVQEINDDKAWPKTKFSAKSYFGVFGETDGIFFQDKELSLFDPKKLSLEIVNLLIKKTKKIDINNFKIKKREGRWLYLDTGRLSGLKVGTRLLGPGGARLHVIRDGQEPGGNRNGGTIAFIRHEDPKKLLKAGDVLQLDKKVYP